MFVNVAGSAFADPYLLQAYRSGMGDLAPQSLGL